MRSAINLELGEVNRVQPSLGMGLGAWTSQHCPVSAFGAVRSAQDLHVHFSLQQRPRGATTTFDTTLEQEVFFSTMAPIP